MNAQIHAPCLVLDKSFAQSIKGSRLSILSRERTLLVPRAFHYEVFTTAEKKMYKTLVGLDDFRWVDKEDLLRSERDNGEPCRSAELTRFCVDPNVLHPTWKPSSAECEAADKYRNESVDPFILYWDLLRNFNPTGFTSTELMAIGGSEAEFQHLCEKLREPERIRFFAREVKFKHAEEIDESWYTFRYFQTFGLQYLVLLRRYKNIDSRPCRVRMEHDVHDMDYLTLGLHVGSLATNDVSPKLKKASLGWRFKLLEPNFELVLPSD